MGTELEPTVITNLSGWAKVAEGTNIVSITTLNECGIVILTCNLNAICQTMIHIYISIYIFISYSCGSVVEHCVSSAKGHGFNSQGTHILTINV